MAKRKKSRDQQTSNGERRNVTNGKHRKSDWTPLQRLLHQVNAWKQGKTVMLTVPNPNKNETAKPFIRKKATDVWGQPKKWTMKVVAE
mgnify:CR=1 FL=1